jgi:hypothetical protein
MPADSPTRPRLSQGERLRRIAYAATAICGALLALAVTLHLGQRDSAGFALTTYDLWVTVTGLAGGYAGLHVTEHYFGHPGLRGTLQALGGIVLICLAAPVIAGTLALPLYGTMFGPFMLGTTLAALPLLGLLWTMTLVAVHLCLTPWRRERDSVFVAPTAPQGKAAGQFTPRRGSSGYP